MALSQERLPITVSTPLGTDVLVLRAFHGEERVSALFRYTLHMVSDDPALAFADVVGERATVAVRMADGTERWFNGIVGRFVQAGTGPRGTAYYADLHPWLWMLTLASDCRIFQNQTVPEILETVFGDLGFSDHRSALSGTYPAREYCVQYRETAFDFVSRLMEEEGIFYFWEHADGVHTLVLGDDVDAFAATPGVGSVRYAQTATEAEVEDVVVRCTWERQVATGKVALEDYGFETPDTDLLVSVEGTGSDMARYDYPGGFTDSGEGERLARTRIEAAEAHAVLLRGEGTVRGMTAGHRFTLAGHARDEVNAEWVVLALSVSASQETYSNSFEAIPADVPFRPARTARKPVIGGTQTALVVGKAGEKMWVDAHGRIKVQFHWDRAGTRDETSSCWVRVAQPSAGQGWGNVFIPRLGQEVVVSFLEGDPDRPLVTGAVYNASMTPAYPLPGEQARSVIRTESMGEGGGYNELRFDDSADAEDLYLHAARDHHVEVVNDRFVQVDHDETHTVKNDRTLTVEEGNQALTVTQGSRTVTVSEGDETLTVSKGKRTVAVTDGDEAHTVGGKRSVTVTGDETHANDAKFTHETGGAYTLKVTGDLTIEASGAVTIKAGGALTVKSGTALAVQSGTALELKAGTSLAGKAATTLDLEANAALTAKANATARLEGSAMAQVKGGMVQIN